MTNTPAHKRSTGDWRLHAGHNPGQELLGKLAEAAQGQMANFSSQNISNAVMAFAKLEAHPGKQLLEAVCEATLSRLGTFTPQA